jgi:hypothetical protein
METYIQSREYVKDLTSEGIEPNPGPPKEDKRGPRHRLNNRRERRNYGISLDFSFSVKITECPIHPMSQCGTYIVAPRIKDQFGQPLISNTYCTQVGTYNVNYETAIIWDIGLRYELYMQNGQQQVWRQTYFTPDTKS